MHTDIKSFTAQAGCGRTGLTAQVQDTGDGISILLTGGEKPHVGAVALALPRASLANAAEQSSDPSLLCRPGHKDWLIALSLAQTVAAACATACVVTAGVHSDAMTAAEIATVQAQTSTLAEEIIRQLQER